VTSHTPPQWWLDEQARRAAAPPGQIRAEGEAILARVHAAHREVGGSIRDALEAGDSQKAARLRGELAHTEALIRHTFGPPPKSMDHDSRFQGAAYLAAALTLPEVNELDLDDRHGAALRVTLALSRDTDPVAAALIGLLLEWPRFREERELWRRESHRPAAWTEALLGAEPSLGDAASVAALSVDARAVLGFPKLLRRTQEVSVAQIDRRAFFPTPRTLAALDELVSCDLARPVTAATEPAGLDPTDPVTGDAVFAVGLGRSLPRATLRWWSELGALAGRWLHRCAYRGEIVFRLGRAEQDDEGDAPTIIQVRHGDVHCPVCWKAPHRVRVWEPERLPPYHLGCTCSA
jgi:hypothetical protein